MKTTMCRRLAMLPAMILCLLLAGCGGDDAGDAGEAVDEPAPAADTAVTASTREAAPVDWSAVNAGSKYDGTALAIELARQLSAWHDGAHSYVILRIDTDGAVTDRFGNVVQKKLSHWKALVQLINAGSDKWLGMKTPPMDLPGDGLGELREWVYIITVNSPDELQFTCEGEFQG